MSSYSLASLRVRGGKRDYRKAALVLMVAGTITLGYVISLMPGRGISSPTIAAQPKPADFSSLPATPTATERSKVELLPEPAATGKDADPKTAQTNQILNDAKRKILAKRYDDAIASLVQSREKIQHDPRSYLVMARALEGKKDYNVARDFYNAASDKDPYLADAYFGFATTSEAMGDLEAAIGGMRNFLHVQAKPDPEKLKVAQARSAIWEWESKLGRGAWGPTKGIPPGYSEEELKRDGRGVAIKMPLPGTKGADGRSKYEIKHSDKFEIFKP